MAVASAEANTAMRLLERPNLKVMVVIIAAHSDPHGTTDIIHSVSSNTRVSHLRQFRSGLAHRVKFITERLNK